MDPNILDFAMRAFDDVFSRDMRWNLLRDLSGRILEVGMGTGLNLSLYQNGSKVFGTDPDLRALRMALDRERGKDFFAVLSKAENLPFKDGIFDGIISTFVFCTVEDPNLAIREIWRVLKFGGELRMLEHVRVSWLAPVQDAITPIWKYLAGGCHLNRDTLKVVKDAGFKLEFIRESFFGIILELYARKV